MANRFDDECDDFDDDVEVYLRHYSGGDGCGIVGLDWDSDELINGPYDGDTERCQCRYAAIQTAVLPPDVLRENAWSAIDSVIDRDAFDAEFAAERGDAVFLVGVLKTIRTSLQDVDSEDTD